MSDVVQSKIYVDKVSGNIVIDLGVVTITATLLQAMQMQETLKSCIETVHNMILQKRMEAE